MLRQAMLVVMLVLLPIAAADVAPTAPTYWSARGDATWFLSERPSGHGGQPVPPTICEGSVRITAYGPVLRKIEGTEVADLRVGDVTIGDANEHGAYRIRVDAESASDACPSGSWSFYTPYHPRDGFRHEIDCSTTECTTISLDWPSAAAADFALDHVQGLETLEIRGAIQEDALSPPQ